MSNVIRSVKNVTKGYSAVQVKVRNGERVYPRGSSSILIGASAATSNVPWGPTGMEMSEIAQMTFNS